MKQLTKKLAALSLLFSLLALPSCKASKKSYADDLSCAELTQAVEAQIPVNFGYESFGGEHIQYYFEGTTLPDDHSLRYSVLSEDLNEVGIFHSPDEASAREMLRLTEEYLSTLLEDKKAFIESYASEELPKLEEAEVRNFGNYTVYAILEEQDRKLVFETVEKKLTRE